MRDIKYSENKKPPSKMKRVLKAGCIFIDS
jgi:hypothetical protein